MDADCKTLWIGDIQMHWDEAFIGSLFASMGTCYVWRLLLASVDRAARGGLKQSHDRLLLEGPKGFCPVLNEVLYLSLDGVCVCR